MQQHNLGTEAIRAFFTLQCCWLNNEEIYLEKGCQHCGSAATYLMYFTNIHIQKLMLKFINQYNCHLSKGLDLLDLHDFEENYNGFLQILENEVNFYVRRHHEIPSELAFEQIESIFERSFRMAC
ncbi:hypothetical protein [Acinetobacter sp. ANC 4648]|uniref:hypothetical protein n=1 Tax=Acinetobacter sp. ANC 4648 TaxID=1977875 RepID=UPI000A3592F5|nr:hypothetical protein [Acinetobacter sp. ANC 4648]OTG84993.1 hypothetical protein B9T27_01890 [Acinetobacter sp. ANC 4648]